jgi:hypothetical protein
MLKVLSPRMFLYFSIYFVLPLYAFGLCYPNFWYYYGLCYPNLLYLNVDFYDLYVFGIPPNPCNVRATD